MSEQQSEQTDRLQDYAERVVSNMWSGALFRAMWSTCQVFPPGQKWETVREVISEYAERRPARPVDPSHAHALLGRHALAGSVPFEMEAPVLGSTLSLTADEGVFNPTETHASLFLLRIVALASLEGKRFLDAFSGTGFVGIYAAARGATVTAYDTSKRAVTCAQKNVQRNDLSDRMEVRHGDYTCLAPGEQFDLMAANPPLLPGQPDAHQPLSEAVFDSKLGATESFIGGALPGHLAPDGRCYLLTSSPFDQENRDVYSVCEQNGLKARLAIAMARPTEWYRIHEIRRAD